MLACIMPSATQQRINPKLGCCLRPLLLLGVAFKTKHQQSTPSANPIEPIPEFQGEEDKFQEATEDMTRSTRSFRHRGGYGSVFVCGYNLLVLKGSQKPNPTILGGPLKKDTPIFARLYLLAWVLCSLPSIPGEYEEATREQAEIPLNYSGVCKIQGIQRKLVG